MYIITNKYSKKLKIKFDGKKLYEPVKSEELEKLILIDESRDQLALLVGVTNVKIINTNPPIKTAIKKNVYK